MNLPRSILFVCTGNICRSPMAEYLLRDRLAKDGLHGIEVFSRGVGAMEGTPMSRHALAELNELGINGSAHRAANITATDVARADTILVMTRDHGASVIGGFPEARKKVSLLKVYAGVPSGASDEVADPFGESREAYRRCRIDIQSTLDGVLGKIRP